jgi:hypothetical protein
MQGTMKKVLIPVTNEKTGKTYWNRGGISLPNRDGSWNVYLDVLPLNGKLQLRDFDEEDRRGSRGGGGDPGGGPVADSNTQIPF